MKTQIRVLATAALATALVLICCKGDKADKGTGSKTNKAKGAATQATAKKARKALEKTPKQPKDAPKPVPKTVQLPDNGIKAVAVRAFSQNACAILASGVVHCWGYGNQGALGTGKYETTNKPGKPVKDLGDAKQNAAQEGTVCAIRGAGEVGCWGSNEFGRLGNGKTKDSAVPVAVKGITDAVQIAVSKANTCVISAARGLLCWGNNSYGQLIGVKNLKKPKLKPVVVKEVTDVVEIALAEFTVCARLKTGKVQCWGGHNYNKLGKAELVDKVQWSYTPVEVTGLTDVKQLAGNTYHFCALRATGQVLCWGRNREGQLGDGTVKDRGVPTPVKGLSNVTSIAVGYQHTCAVVKTGEVWCWGENDKGQLGDGTRKNQSSPVRVAGPANVVEVTAATTMTCGRRKSGGLFCWGDNSAGQLGGGDNKPHTGPVVVTAP